MGAEDVRAKALEVGPDAPSSWRPLGPAGRDSVQGIGLPGQLINDYRRSGVFAVLGALTFDAGARSAPLLARAHPSGRWVEWLSPGPP